MIINNKKSIIKSLITSAFIVIPCVASANITEKSFSQNCGIVSFEGVTDAENMSLTYTVSSADEDAMIADIGEFNAEADGSFEFSFGLKASGDYILRIKDSDADIIEKNFSYKNAKDRAEYLLVQVNSGDTEDIKEVISECNFSFNDKAWKDISDKDFKDFVASGIKEARQYENLEDVEEEYKILNMLYEIRVSKATGIVPVLKKYEDALGIDEDDEVKSFFSKANDAKKRALVTILSEKSVYNISDLVDAIKEANKAKTSDSDGSSGGGGGGSTSGKGASTAGSATILYPAANNTEDDTQAEVISYYDLNEADWAKDAVMSLSEQGIVSGDGNGYFRPNDKVKREEFVKMVVMAFSIPYENANCDFIDVFKNDWFYEYVGAANNAGVVKGLSEDFFGVHKNITRQDAAVILARAAEYAGAELEVVRDSVSFLDNTEIAEYAKDAIVKLYQNGTVNGMPDGSFKPQNVCTRAEAAKMIFELCKGGAV